MNEIDPVRERMDDEGKRATDMMFSKHYVMTGTIFVYVVGGLFIFAGGGFLLDQYAGTKPAFMIFGVILSFVLTQMAIIRKFSYRKKK